MINFVVVTHGEFGAYLVEAAENIVGPQKSGVRCLSISARLSLEELRDRLTQAISELSPAEGIVIAVDMPGGTPCNLAIPLVKDSSRISVVSGINLYMLVTAFSCRRKATLEDITEKMIQAGKKAVMDVKASFLASMKA